MNYAKHYKQMYKHLSKDNEQVNLNGILTVIIVCAVITFCVASLLNWLMQSTNLYFNKPTIKEQYNDTIIVYDRSITKSNSNI